MHTHYSHAHVPVHTPSIIHSLILTLAHTPSYTHTHTHGRCRLTQRSTWGVTLEREGHWEMFFATCRASILRAASTSSSWAAHMRGKGWWMSGIREEGCGPKREQRENIETRWAHTLAGVYISHTDNLFSHSKLKTANQVKGGKWWENVEAGCTVVTWQWEKHSHNAHTTHVRATNELPGSSRVSQRGRVWSVNKPVVFGRMQWGWSQPGQAPCTAGSRHTQTACLTRAWEEKGPPQVPG